MCGFEAGTRALLFDGRGAFDVLTVAAAADPTLQVEYPGALSRTYVAGSAITRIETPTYYLKAATAQLMRYDGHRSDFPLVDNVVKLEFRYFGDPQPPRRIGATGASNAARPLTTYGPSPPPLGVDEADDAWPAGENCVFAVQDGEQVARLAVLAPAGEVELSGERLTDGPWCPDEAQANRFDADLLRIRRVSVTLRVQAALSLLRGPAGVLFARAGTARSAGYYVPDLEIRFDIAPRNMNLRP
jgi:hypothetical protein